MRYAFVINPASGKSGRNKDIIKSVEQLIANHIDEDIGIYYTLEPEDACRMADTLALEAMRAGDDIVIFACGGDGTAHEIANGLYGYDNAILGLVPIGSGNDLCRALSKGKRSYKDYIDLEKQMMGRPREMDVIEISWEENGEEKSCIAINSVNIGFDGNTAIRADELNERMVFSGSLSYLIAVFSTLIKKEGQSLRITADGEVFYDGDLLMATMGNGNYCGGGIESCPRAVLDDGLIELLVVKDLSRMSFVSKFPKFRAGGIFEIKGADDIACYKQVREVIIEPLRADEMEFVIDGEVYKTPKIRAEIQPKGITVWEI